MEESRAELAKLMTEKRLSDALLLVYANKQVKVYIFITARHFIYKANKKSYNAVILQLNVLQFKCTTRYFIYKANKRLYNAVILQLKARNMFYLLFIDWFS